MRSVGLITEYNPFHNGHLYHLEESKKAAGAEVAVAVMSGHFLQRGEPALVDKWVRAEMALRAGVDVVIELPFAWACNSAPHFATGAVQALNALGGVDALCFGSESGDLKALEGCARLLLEQEDEVLRRTSQLLRAGKNYPEARALVAEELSNDKAIAELLASPNNILGIEYLKALVPGPATMKPVPSIKSPAPPASGTCSKKGSRSIPISLRPLMSRCDKPSTKAAAAMPATFTACCCHESSGGPIRWWGYTRPRMVLSGACSRPPRPAAT